MIHTHTLVRGGGGGGRYSLTPPSSLISASGGDLPGFLGTGLGGGGFLDILSSHTDTHTHAMNGRHCPPLLLPTSAMRFTLMMITRVTFSNGRVHIGSRVPLKMAELCNH